MPGLMCDLVWADPYSGDGYVTFAFLRKPRGSVSFFKEFNEIRQVTSEKVSQNISGSISNEFASFRGFVF